MKTNAYIDGFNLYYGCFKRDPSTHGCKWLDPRALCEAILKTELPRRLARDFWEGRKKREIP